MERVCGKEDVTPNREELTVVTVKSEKQPLGATGFNPVVTRGTHPRERGTKPRHSPWHSQAYWCYGSTAFRGWRKPETTTITCQKATMATTGLSKIS